MNISTSDYSSGCESGWTMYLDQFSSSTDHQHNRSMPLDQYDYQSKGKYVNQEEDDEDLSMLSDASSGPPHFHQEEENSENNRYVTPNSSAAYDSKKGKHKKKGKEHKGSQSVNFHLDDTASSPAFNFSKKNAYNNDNSMVYPHHSAFSTTRLKGKSVLGFFKPSTERKGD